MAIDITNKIGARPDGQKTFRLLTRIRDNNELPYKITLSYYDVDLNGAPGVVHSETVSKGGRVVNVNFPVFMRRSEAKTLADRLLLKAWRERIEYRFTAQMDFAVYDPGDVLEITDSETNKTIKLRVTEIQIDPRGFVSISGVRHDPSVYTHTASYSDNTSAAPSAPTYDNAQFVLFQSRDIAYDQPPPKFFIAVKKTQNWKGGTIYASTDGGASWEVLGDAASSTFIGKTVNSLPARNWATRDLTDTLVVKPDADCIYDLTSKTLSETLNGSNTFFINGELIRAEEVTLNANGEYELKRIHRGVRGTESLADFAIAPNSQVILMANAIPVDFGRIGDVVEVRIPVTQQGESVNSVSGLQLQLTDLPDRALAPVRPSATWHSNGDLTVQWTYRNRLARDWNGYADVPKDPDFNEYMIEINGAAYSSDAESIKLIRHLHFSPAAQYTIRIWQKTKSVEDGEKLTFTVYDGINYRGVQ